MPLLSHLTVALITLTQRRLGAAFFLSCLVFNMLFLLSAVRGSKSVQEFRKKKIRMMPEREVWDGRQRAGLLFFCEDVGSKGNVVATKFFFLFFFCRVWWFTKLDLSLSPGKKRVPCLPADDWTHQPIVSGDRLTIVLF